MKWIIIRLVIIATCFTYLGFVFRGTLAPPKIVYLDKPIEIIREVPPPPPVVITKTATLEKERTVYTNIFPRQFKSVAEFKLWYEGQSFNPLFNVAADCDDYATRVQTEALKQGYSVSIALADKDGTVYGVYVGKAYHMGNLVVIGNEVYYAEPEPGQFRMTKITDRD